jgi:DNA-binding MarR family transcriptional regulator
MVEAGYAERVVDPGDARARRVQLSARGRALLVDVEEIWAQLEEGWSQTLGGARLEELRGDLETVLRATHGGTLPAVRTVS